jgi:hypothetical protein
MTPKKTIINTLCIFLVTYMTASASPNSITLMYSYGHPFYPASVLKGTSLSLEESKDYSDLIINSQFKVIERLTAFWSLELTTLPHLFIGTKFSRQDFIFSTGRVQESGLQYESKLLSVTVGRADLMTERFRPGYFRSPISGDGFMWQLTKNDWSFRHSFQILPAESDETRTFRRSLSYHHLQRQIGPLSVGVGEYFILSGETIGFDLKRFNPFVPYSLNSHDSEADNYPGYAGDSDNALIKLFLNWEVKAYSIFLRTYIDEFHIDEDDRARLSDAILLHGGVQNKMIVGDLPVNALIGISVSNPNFGQHPGPFTTATSAQYPLFEYNPGMLSLMFAEFESQLLAHFKTSLGVYSERWVDLSQILPVDRNKRSQLEVLDVNQEFTLSYQLEYQLQNRPLLIGLKNEWTENQLSSYQFYLRTNFSW